MTDKSYAEGDRQQHGRKRPPGELPMRDRKLCESGRLRSCGRTMRVSNAREVIAVDNAVHNIHTTTCDSGLQSDEHGTHTSAALHGCTPLSHDDETRHGCTTRSHDAAA